MADTDVNDTSEAPAATGNPPSAPAAARPTGSRWLPAVVLVLAVAVIAELVILARVRSSTPTAPTPPPAVGMSGAPAGQAAPQPAAVDTPFVGPTPTSDTGAWTYIPGDFLLGALSRVDATAGTTLSSAQWQQIKELFREVAPIAQAATDAEDKLTRLAAQVLTEPQLKDLTENRKAIVNSAIDGDRLLRDLKGSVKSGAGTSNPTPPTAQRPRFAANYLLAGLQFLLRSDQHPLTSNQVERLLPAVADDVEKTKAQAAVYPRVKSILNAAQFTLFVQTLGDMRSGKLDPATAKKTLGEMTAYVKTRESR